MTRTGALVVSLDFELHWGVRHRRSTTGPYRRNLLGAREAIPRILDLFTETGVAATWATVGFLFARSREELRSLWPSVRPAYRDPGLDPYREPVGEDERDDPFHFAPSLIERIRTTPGQEIATHTFSHYRSMAPGQTREAFAADIGAAVAVARDRGIKLSSIVFPRNEVDPGYQDVLLDHGITCYRGSQRGWIHRPGRKGLPVRALRLLDAYSPVTGMGLVGWDEILEPSGLCNVRATRFLRPATGTSLGPLERGRLALLRTVLNRAASTGRIAHLWWHPHNFGAAVDTNLALLREVLASFARLRDERGMASLAMRDVTRLVRGEIPSR